MVNKDDYVRILMNDHNAGIERYFATEPITKVTLYATFYTASKSQSVIEGGNESYEIMTTPVCLLCLLCLLFTV